MNVRKVDILLMVNAHPPIAGSLIKDAQQTSLTDLGEAARANRFDPRIRDGDALS